MTDELIGKEDGAFRSGREFVNQIVTLWQMGEKMRERRRIENCNLFYGFGTGKLCGRC